MDDENPYTGPQPDQSAERAKRIAARKKLKAQPQTRGQRAAAGIFGVSALFCGAEIVPAWSALQLGWPPYVLYGIMAVSWAVAGFLEDPRHRAAGLLGGAAGGLGGLLAMSLFLEFTPWLNLYILLIVALIGAAPGWLVYKGLARMQDSLAPPMPDV